VLPGTKEGWSVSNRRKGHNTSQGWSTTFHLLDRLFQQQITFLSTQQINLWTTFLVDGDSIPQRSKEINVSGVEIRCQPLVEMQSDVSLFLIFSLLFLSCLMLRQFVVPFHQPQERHRAATKREAEGKTNEKMRMIREELAVQTIRPPGCKTRRWDGETRD